MELQIQPSPANDQNTSAKVFSGKLKKRLSLRGMENNILEDWYQRVRVTQLAHYKTSYQFGKRKYLLSIPAIILSALVGSTVFASLQEKSELWLQILVGLAIVAAAVFTSLQAFLGYSERAEKHRIAGAKYGAIGRERGFLKEKECIEDEIVINIKSRLDNLAVESPKNPNKIYYSVGTAELE